jgi:hypothetical protein
MTLDLEPTLPPSEPTTKTERASVSDSPAHGTVERCEFEELLERAMEILKVRRAGAGSRTA